MPDHAIMLWAVRFDVDKMDPTSAARIRDPSTANQAAREALDGLEEREPAIDGSTAVVLHPEALTANDVDRLRELGLEPEKLGLHVTRGGG